MSDSTTEKQGKKQLSTVLKVIGLAAVLALIALRSLYLPSVVPGIPETTKVEGLIDDGHYDQAIEATTGMIHQTPEWGWPLMARGEAYRRKGDLDRALRDLNEAIRLDPGASEALYDRCLVFHENGDLDQALRDCDASARIKPDFNSQEATVALLLAKGDFDRAYDGLTALIAAPGSEASLPGLGASMLVAPLFYRGQISLFLYNRPAEAAADLAKAAGQALMDNATAIDFSAYVPGENASRRIPLAFQFNPDGFHLMIWNHIARVRAGQDDTGELAEHLELLKTPIQSVLIGKLSTDNTALAAEQHALTPWPAVIFALFIGKSTPEAVHLAAEADPVLLGKRRCEADFYLAEYDLEKDLAEEARKLLQMVSGECQPGEEQRLAAWELKRLKS